jgi:hypothetical protein
MRNGQGEKTIEEFSRLGTPSLPMRISRDTRKHPKSEELKLIMPTVLLFDSTTNFNRTHKNIVFKHNNATNHPHLVHIHNATFDDIQAAAMKNFSIDKTIFLFNESKHSIDLATSFMFSPGVCHANQFKVINRFTRRQMKWENSTFFVEKYRNFHGCTLEFRKEYLVEGITMLYADLAKELNFTMKAVESFNPQTAITFYIWVFSSTAINSFNFHTIQFESRKIFIPPGEVYGDFEKMFLPFDLLTWILISLTIVLSVLAVVVIKFTPLEVQNLVFGRNNRSPLLNLIAIFINGGQDEAVHENAPRMLILSLVLWSLIFR